MDESATLLPAFARVAQFEKLGSLDAYWRNLLFEATSTNISTTPMELEVEKRVQLYLKQTIAS